MEKTMTKAQQLIEIASWVKRQPTEFTKNFKSMNSIIRVYKALPADYDRTKSLLAYIKKNATRMQIRDLMRIFNAEFKFRYFTDAPYRYAFQFGLSRWSRPGGNEHIEVRCDVTDYCNIFDNYARCTHGGATITIKDLSEAKAAVDRLLEDRKKSLGDDFEATYGEKLKAAMKQAKPTDRELSVGYEVVF